MHLVNRVLQTGRCLKANFVVVISANGPRPASSAHLHARTHCEQQTVFPDYTTYKVLRNEHIFSLRTLNVPDSCFSFFNHSRGPFGASCFSPEQLPGYKCVNGSAAHLISALSGRAQVCTVASSN